MRNDYFINRHYVNTDKIRLAIGRMNKDIRELSEYCDKLEKLIDELLEFIEDTLDEEVISNTFDMTTKEFIDHIKSGLISR